MSYFNAKMHQIQFWLGLFTRPALAGFKGLTSKERSGEGKESGVRERKVDGEGV